jgi:hypothetical protein
MTHRIGPDYKSLRMSLGACLNCGEELTGVGRLDDEAVPQDGAAIMVCLYCSHAMEWVGGRLVELSDEAVKQMAGDKELTEATKFAGEFQRRGKRQR